MEKVSVALLCIAVVVWLALGIDPSSAKPMICIALGPLGCDMSTACLPWCHIDNTPIPVRDMAAIASMIAAYTLGQTSKTP